MQNWTIKDWFWFGATVPVGRLNQFRTPEDDQLIKDKSIITNYDVVTSTITFKSGV